MQMLLRLMVLVLLLPCLAAAQGMGGITGVARDTSGAVLPGVTVEAASPALIEKVRAAITDGQGQFNIIDLRPGTYSVTFTLPGFATYKREGIELSAGFTATANAEMRVGGVEESITVTGASPTVDIRNVRTQRVLQSEVMKLLPSGGTNYSTFASLTLGAASTLNDVGGDKSERLTPISVRGGRGEDGRLFLDGMYVNYNGGATSFIANSVAVQETVLDTGGNFAESETGGANLNMVPKDGGNRFSLFGTANYSDHRFSAKGVPDSLIARGTGPQSSLKLVYDYGLGLGGPIKRDRLWFYASNKWWGAQNFATNNYFNKSTNPYVYVPDLTRQAYADFFYRDNGVRLTWQVAPKHKITQLIAFQLGCMCWQAFTGGVFSAPEATLDSINGPSEFSSTTWTYVASNKLLIEAGASLLDTFIEVPGIGGYALTKNVFTAGGTAVYAGPNTFSITELSTGYLWGGRTGSPGIYAKYIMRPFTQRVSASYATGSHAAKVGLQTFQSRNDRDGMLVSGNNQLEYQFRNGAPVSLTQWAGPMLGRVRLRSLALYAQDQWTIRRLTLNLGVRFDHFWGYTQPVDIPAGPFIGARSVPGLRDLPNFKDMTPRLGAAYDVFGNGRTAIKAAFGKYLMGQSDSVPSTLGPSTAIVQNVRRTWNDGNGNFVPDCVLTTPQANGECGQVSNLAFGQPVTNVTYADDALRGWGVREYDYQASVQLQHELRPGVGLAVGYFRTWWGNMTVDQNTAVTAADFSEYCITAPTDPRLNTSGHRICGFYDVNPSRFGRVTRVVTRANNFGTPEELFNGVDVAVTARWGRGALLNGGLSVGRQTFDYCYVNGRPDLTPQGFPAGYPRSEAFCRPQSEWWDGSGSQVKFMVVQPLRWDVVVSGTFKNQAGVPQTANLVLGNAQIAPSLGRNLSACPAVGTCTATATHSLIPSARVNTLGSGGASAPTQVDMRLNQADVRVSKIVRLGRTRLQGFFDIYNLFNARPPQALVATYGASWLQPSQLLGGRLFKFGTQVDW